MTANGSDRQGEMPTLGMDSVIYMAIILLTVWWLIWRVRHAI